MKLKLAAEFYKWTPRKMGGLPYRACLATGERKKNKPTEDYPLPLP